MKNEKIKIIKKGKKILFFTNYFFYPEEKGGAQISNLILLSSLKKLHNYEVTIVCVTENKETKGSFLYSLEFLNGIKIIRIPKTNNFEYFREKILFYIKEEQPKYIISEFFSHNDENILSFLDSFNEIKTFCFVRVVEPLFEFKINLLNTKLIANSDFTRDAIKETLNIDTEIIYPPLMFDCLLKKTNDFKNKKKITFINPIPEKGVDVALGIAKLLPEEEFLFVLGGWKTGQKNHNSIKEICVDIENIEVREYQYDLTQIFGETKLLIVPSQFLETFNRSVIEFGLMGIPALVSDRGNLKYTVDQIFLVVEDYKNPMAYVDKIKKILSDEIMYEELSLKSKENSVKEKYTKKYNVHKLIELLEK